MDSNAFAAIAEIFDQIDECRPRVVALVGPPGCGNTAAIGEIARAADAAGLVPVNVARVNEAVAAAAGGRTLLLIDDNSDGRGWRTLVSLAMASPRPHVLLVTSEEEMAGVDCVMLDKLSTRGIGRPAGSVRGRRAAEQPAAYNVAPDPLHVVPPQAAHVRPAAGELEGLRQRVDEAKRLIVAGRHAPGERALRQAIGGLARRGDWDHASLGSIALARALLTRGRPREAQAALEGGREHCARTGRDDLLIQSASLAGHAWIDLARLDEAEAVLTAAQLSARGLGCREAGADLALAMARCLFWRGRYAEADTAIADFADRDLPEPTRVRAAIAHSRNAVGLRDYGTAVRSAADGHARALALRDGNLAAAAASASALAHLSVSDFDGVARDITLAVQHARSVRAPLRAIRARLLLAEAERRRDHRAAAGILLRKLGRVAAGNLPPIVAARAELLAALLKPDASARDVIARHAGAGGLAALRLMAPEPLTAGQEPHNASVLVDQFVEILKLCQTADEESAVLKEVCAHLRRDLRAAGVAIVPAGDASAPPVATDGSRVERAIALRAIAAAAPISPHRIEHRIEAAAPVCYGGTSIAAVVARWTIGNTHDLSRATALLTVAATAAAAAVAAALARRSAPASFEPNDILGVSAAAADLRRSIGRAALAPFAVLIEGESGSGKELVARALHRGGPRRTRPFCTLNCAALPDDLIESELFGHARGAFTGAVAERPGVFEEANGGTLFLDEVGELSPRAQAKLLRVIQEGELRRLGENVPRRVDVRIISATNRSLRDEVTAGRFRLDLLYRLDVIRIPVAPLRERREDVAVLAAHVWADVTRRLGSQAMLAPAAIAALARYDWPGNVRELQNVLAALAVRISKRGVVPVSALPAQFAAVRPNDVWRLEDARRTFDEQFVRAALVRTGGRRAQTASELGVSRQGLTKLMTRLGITP